jgi:hypothetical protein
MRRTALISLPKILGEKRPVRATIETSRRREGETSGKSSDNGIDRDLGNPYDEKGRPKTIK